MAQARPKISSGDSRQNVIDFALPSGRFGRWPGKPAARLIEPSIIAAVRQLMESKPEHIAMVEGLVLELLKNG
jgi:hypothetical protein